MKLPITKRQGEILLFIKDYDALNHVKPSMRDIADHFGFNSKNASSDHIKALEKKGYLYALENISRGIVITAKGKKYKGEG